MQRAGVPTLLLLAAAPCGSCRKPRDPRAIERLVPATEAPPSNPELEPRTPPPRAPAPASARRRDAGAVTFITDRPAPQGALGVRFGMTRAEVLALNRGAQITCRDADEYTFCQRALVPLAMEVVATYEFCGPRLCGVALDGARTRDEERLEHEYEVLLALVRTELGTPVTQDRRIAPGCRGHLALCLTSRQSELTARWTWRDGPQAMISADQTEDDAFLAQVAVTVLAAERVARPASPELPAPQPPRRDAGTAPDGP